MFFMQTEGTVHQNVVSRLKREQGASTGDFARALRTLCEEVVRANEDAPAEDEDSEIASLLSEWFDWPIDYRPIAFRIDRDPAVYNGIHIHVWEVHPVPVWRFKRYGRIADGDGPVITLHVVERWRGDEIAVLNNDALEPFDAHESVLSEERARELADSYLSKGSTTKSADGEVVADDAAPSDGKYEGTLAIRRRGRPGCLLALSVPDAFVGQRAKSNIGSTDSTVTLAAHGGGMFRRVGRRAELVIARSSIGFNVPEPGNEVRKWPVAITLTAGVMTFATPPALTAPDWTVEPRRTWFTRGVNKNDAKPPRAASPRVMDSTARTATDRLFEILKDDINVTAEYVYELLRAEGHRIGRDLVRNRVYTVRAACRSGFFRGSVGAERNAVEIGTDATSMYRAIVELRRTATALRDVGAKWFLDQDGLPDATVPGLSAGIIGRLLAHEPVNTTRASRRSVEDQAILRAVREMGLIKPGELSND